MNLTESELMSPEVFDELWIRKLFEERGVRSVATRDRHKAAVLLAAECRVRARLDEMSCSK